MAKKFIATLSLLSILLGPCAYAQSDHRSCFDSILQKQVGVREQGGDNKGEKVHEYIEASGFDRPIPWCGSLIYWAGKQCGFTFDVKHPALSASYFTDPDKVIWKRGDRVTERPEKGALIGIYFRSKGRIAHIGELHDWLPGTRYVITIEGNTNTRGSRRGNGVYLRQRRKDEIYMIADHFKK